MAWKNSYSSRKAKVRILRFTCLNEKINQLSRSYSFNGKTTQARRGSSIRYSKLNQNDDIKKIKSKKIILKSE